MCDVITPDAGPLGCLQGNRFLCSNLEACPHAVELFGVFITRLCLSHVAFCRHCAKAFCPQCVERHQAECARRPKEFGEMVERVFGMGST